MEMRHHNKKIIALSLAAIMLNGVSAEAEVKRSKIGDDITKVLVNDDPWQPDTFKDGIAIPASYVADANIVLDGIDNESAWATAEEVTVPLSFGNAESAQLKALYTDEDVLMRVRWADKSKDTLHHPWVWNEKSGNYETGPQVEDSLMLNFEAGCEWFPSFLAGYEFDFDAWHWQAGRTDPFGQALDLSGSVKETKLPGNIGYASRNSEDEWNLRFTDRNDGILHKPWDELERQYMRWPVMGTVFYGDRLDSTRTVGFARLLPPPADPPSSPLSSPAALQPQFEPFELKGNAADVRAKGHWENGFWTVEFRRKRITEGGSTWDIQFERLTQFSLHVFDHTERLDQSSESPRLFFQFLEKELLAESDLNPQLASE
jgi:hypothetical protein